MGSYNTHLFFRAPKYRPTSCQKWRVSRAPELFSTSEFIQNIAHIERDSDKVNVSQLWEFYVKFAHRKRGFHRYRNIKITIILVDNINSRSSLL